MVYWKRIKEAWQRTDARLDAWIGDLWSLEEPTTPPEDPRSTRSILVNVVVPIVCTIVFVVAYILDHRR